MAPSRSKRPAILRTPRTPSLALARAIGDHDLAAAAHCFARDACFLTPDATAVCGRTEIRPILAQMIASDVRIETEVGPLLLAGDVAFGLERWHFFHRDSDGISFRRSSWANLILQRLEGNWKLAIAAPWGVGVPTHASTAGPALDRALRTPAAG